MRRLMVVGLGALVLASCSTSASNSSSSTTSSTGPSSSTTTSTVSSSPGGSNLPAVANATDLKVAPVISAGTGPAPSSLETKDLVVGTGARATSTSTVNVQYVGANFADGKVFDSSWQHSGGQPISFPLNQVIPGFAQGIVGMQVGGRREIVIPSQLGYGARGAGASVGPNENLVFVVDLVGVS